MMMMMMMLKGIYSICPMNRRFNAFYKRTYRKIEITRGYKKRVSNQTDRDISTDHLYAKHAGTALG